MRTVATAAEGISARHADCRERPSTVPALITGARRTIEKPQYLEIMTMFPTGVGVITSLDASGRPVGLTSNAISSVCADPPILLVCIAKSSRSLETIRATGRFAVNFLDDRSESICTRFASQLSAAEKFSAVAWSAAPGSGMPVLHDHVVAYADCEIQREVEVVTHVIALARVVGGATMGGDREPAAYVKRSFRSWPSVS